MNTESVDGRRITDPSSLMGGGGQKPGDFAWEFDFTHFDHGAKPTDERLTLYFCLPGQTQWSPIHVQRGQPGDAATWGWDGNFDKPTVTPSVLQNGEWHGHLQAGRFNSC